jgi:hypothetical protein
MLTVATPPFIVFVPMTAAPSVNVIVPVAPGGSVALNVTRLPYDEGFEDEESITAELARDSVSVTEVLDLAKFESPRYDAVTTYEPADNPVN